MNSSFPTAGNHSPEFLRLVRQKNRVAFSLTFAVCVIYFGYLALLGSPGGKAFLSQTLGDSAVTYAIPVGIGVIISAWVLTGIYVFWANGTLDPQVEDFKARYSGESPVSSVKAPQAESDSFSDLNVVAQS